MNKKMFRRILALTLAVVMCFGMGLSAFATTGSDLKKAVISYYNTNGDEIAYGFEFDEDYEFFNLPNAVKDGYETPVAWKAFNQEFELSEKITWNQMVDFVGDNYTSDGVAYVCFDAVYEKAPATKVVKLNFYDAEAGKQVKEVEMTVAADATYVSTGDMEVPAGYELVLTGDLAIADGYVYVEVKAVPTTKVVKLNFYDAEAGKQVKEVEMTVAADATYVNTGDMEVPAGYELVLAGDLTIADGYVYVEVKAVPATKQIYVVYQLEDGTFVWASEKTLEVAADATYYNTNDLKDVPAGYEVQVKGDITFSGENNDMLYVTVKAVPVKRTVTVTFAVNPEQGLFPDYVPSTTVTFENIDEFSEQQFEIPAVEAKEGYKFVGWKGQGADKIEWAADATTFGVTGLAFFQEGSNVGYASVEAVFEKIEAPAPAVKTLKIYWAIDNTDGAVFKASGKSDAWTETIAWADKDNTFVIPELEVKEGYKLAGWSVSGKEANYWDANASTFGLTGLIVENDEGGYVAITANVVVDAPVVEEPEVKPEVKPENKPSSSTSSSSGRKHEDEKFTLYFDENGGSKIKNVTVKSGKEIDLTKSKYAPSREGYTFAGWFKNEDLTKEADSILMYSDHTVYAKWIKDSSSNKANPETGTNDFVAVAVAMAVVSAAGAVFFTRKH